MNRRRHGPIGLDIGARQVKAAQVRHDRDGSWSINALATIPRATDSASVDAREAQRIADVLYRRGFQGAELVLAVPDDKLMTANLELPPRSAEFPIDQVARSEFARTLKAESDAFEFAYWDLPAPARASRSTHVMGVGCRHADVEPLLDALAVAGLEAVALEVGACALTRAGAAWIAGSEEITALVDIGHNATRLLVAYRGVVCYQRTLAGYGVERLHRALADQLGLPSPDVIDRVARQAQLQDTPEAPAKLGGALHDEAAHAIRTHLDAVLVEVVTSLAYSSHQYPDAAVRRVLLCGGGANLAGAGPYLSARHKLDVRAARPADVASLADSVNRAPDALDASLMPALGLAQHDAHAAASKGRVAA